MNNRKQKLTSVDDDCDGKDYDDGDGGDDGYDDGDAKDYDDGDGGDDIDGKDYDDGGDDGDGKDGERRNCCCICPDDN